MLLKDFENALNKSDAVMDLKRDVEEFSANEKFSMPGF